MSDRPMRIWIDLDNTPHVPFFIPISRELRRSGHTVMITARDAYQTCDLADELGVEYRRIGRHYGKNSLKKIVGLLVRTLQLWSFCVRAKPDIALSHGSHSQVLLCNLLRIPTIVIDDYEHSRTVLIDRPRWIILPDALSQTRLARITKRARYYVGIKEDVYVPELQPDSSILTELGLSPEELIVTVRPPASQAHYHNPEGSALLVELMSRIMVTPGARVVLLPRTHQEGESLRTHHPEWFEHEKTIIPDGTLNGLNLLWFSDLAVSGGGTMNREAAALGIPVYSIFRGTMGAVDLRLAEEGRLTLIETPEEIWSTIHLTPRAEPRLLDSSPRPALHDILRHIEDIMRLEVSSGGRA